MDRAGAAGGRRCGDSREGCHALSAGLFGESKQGQDAGNEYCIAREQCARCGANCESLQRGQFCREADETTEPTGGTDIHCAAELPHEVLAGFDWRILGGFAGTDTSGYARDLRIPIRLVEKRDGLAARGTAWSDGGFTTRCKVDIQRSLVQRAIKSPILMMNASGTMGTGCHWPSGSVISSPPGAVSESRIVRLP